MTAGARRPRGSVTLRVRRSLPRPSAALHNRCHSGKRCRRGLYVALPFRAAGGREPTVRGRALAARRSNEDSSQLTRPSSQPPAATLRNCTKTVLGASSDFPRQPDMVDLECTREKKSVPWNPHRGRRIGPRAFGWKRGASAPRRNVAAQAATARAGSPARKCSFHAVLKNSPRGRLRPIQRWAGPLFLATRLP